MKRELIEIEIDIEVYKAIEAQRLSFDESKNDILRRQFGIGRGSQMLTQPPAAFAPPREKRQRRSGQYSVSWTGGQAAGTSLKDVLKTTILALEERSPGFIEILARHRTPRGRRIVASKPEELYPGNPQLVEQGAERLDSRWWFDTNVSTGQCQTYLNVIGDLAAAGAVKLEKLR